MNCGKVLLAMSGGVDSSAAAILLMNCGYHVEGATMRLWSDNEEISESTISSAAEICKILNIKHHVLDYRDDFKNEIVEYFLNEYKNGRTPNPCILCNRRIKFGRFYDYAMSKGFDFISTGHYARIAEKNGQWAVLTSKHIQKDQSYVLYNLKQDMLSHILLPLGDLSKNDVRKVTAEFNLPSAESPESQEICFITNDDYIDFLNKFGAFKSEPGNFVDLSGNILGRHSGITHYTIGQRKGLGTAFGEPRYVVSINSVDNTITLGGNDDTYSSAVVCSDFSFINDDYLKYASFHLSNSCSYPGDGFSSGDEQSAVQAKIRYKSSPADAYISINNGKLRVDFKKPQRAATPGQSVVLYSGEELLGGGVIESVIK